ncbi:MAG: NAD(P)-dependent oxidoreductase [Kaiparowitsia implicata GSE-PSE-MK54-09C]|jgi:3-hydroxyisobutyrate dehydrogenase-like beta-hydroxyacid dehydrogenase|nr:NAD(P)-dependent oxidoreductase [Kaiparowitsia implicata GSE-PSE-MK54-09C]
MSNIAVLGLGAMGGRIARNLIHAGHPLTVWNRSPAAAAALIELGATIAPSPNVAAQGADIVLSMVTDDAASRAVWLDPEVGAVRGIQAGAIAIECSTLTVTWTQTLAAAIEHRGAKFLDAPVVGSRPQADARALIYLVGGSAETLAEARSVLNSAGGAALHHVGSVGHGMAMKLAVNALFGVQVAALAELLGVLGKSGISTACAMDCLGELPVLSPATLAAGKLMVLQHHAPLFPIDLVEKDLRYVMASAQAIAALTPLSDAAQTLYEQAIAQGYGENNITGIVQLFIPA